ncbi:hypothetical protein T440DRAFT_473850 [Plenodomus tracheiphilus IPT5]|uniref:Uncharacterized protein n=1 Tax=Plenodomus tracheiphilus IPT5 TaxID=1408161 RepID=A0A6A7AMF0_9PLEO|nr:hypothetical protein T440DRAFT_473850 [Plenodomus tracheiphilus IPT5]
MAADKVLTLPAVEFEHQKRGTIAGMLFKPVPKVRVRYVRTLARLCHKEEAAATGIEAKKGGFGRR